MAGITYDLTDNGRDSDRYYQDVAAFTDQVLLHGQASAGPLADHFQQYITATAGEEFGSQTEHLLELLVLGVLWRIYGRIACGASKLGLYPLAALTNLRQWDDCFKTSADWGRGILLTYRFARIKNPWINSQFMPAPTGEHLKKLLRWLKATGEFSQEAKRLHSWQDYLIKQPPAAISGAINQAIQFAAWFETMSEAALGKYTRNVDIFLTEKHPLRRFREDYLLCGRQRVEYHLNMVGAEILNRVFRADFLAQKRRALILPSCMRHHTGKECRAYQGLLGLECQGCAGSCPVHRLTRLGADNHFEVYVIPHESSMFADGLAQSEIKANIGVIGVACVLNLLAGGWKVKEMGIPPQCVLLNCCGCKKHWLDQDKTAEINLNQLMKVLNKDGGHRNENVS